MRLKVGDIVVAPAWFKGEAVVTKCAERSGAIKVKPLTKGLRLSRRWLDGWAFTTKTEAVARALMEDGE